MQIISRYSLRQIGRIDQAAQIHRDDGSWLHDCKSPSPPQPLMLSVPLADLRAHPSLLSAPLHNDYRVVCVPSISDVAVLGPEAYHLLSQLPLTTDPRDPTVRHSLEHMHALRLLTDEPNAIPSPPAPEGLVAWLHMTNACNLNCGYCYIQKSSAQMSRQVAFAAIDTVMRSACLHGYRTIMLKYAGGEPLLALPLIAEVHTYARQQAAAHDLHLQAGLLTNGTLLTTQALAQIRELDLQLMISLDGVNSSHDEQRPRHNGRGSLHAVQQGIEQAVQSGIVPQVAITVTSQSITHVPDLVAWLLSQQLPFTISFYRQPRTAAPYAALSEDEERIIAGMRAIYAVIEQHPPRWSVLGSLLDRTDASAAHQRTCAAGDNYLVFDHQGRIAKCQMTLDQPLAHVESVDPLTVLRNDQSSIQNLPVVQKADCQTCEWRYWCAGGCSVATYQATGQFDVPSPNCRIYKALYPDLLRLEGLRLLHWSQVSQLHA